MRIGYDRVSTDDCGKTTILAGSGNPALAILINVVQPGCNRSILK